MDTERGKFVGEAEAKSWMKQIRVGEVVHVKGEDCRVIGFNDRRVVLELMSATERAFANITDAVPEVSDVREYVNRHQRLAKEAKSRKQQRWGRRDGSKG